MSSPLVHVIDDETDLRSSVQQILVAAEFRVETYENIDSWQRALEQAVDWPDCVLVDDLMPGKKGSLYLSEIKAQCPLAYLVMMTAYGSVDHAVSAMKTGADDYLVKPFRRDALVNLVRRGLQQQKLELGEGEIDTDAVLSALANPIRRQILQHLSQQQTLRFMALTRILDIEDHTKVNFHLKQLRSAELVAQSDDAGYQLTPKGRKAFSVLRMLEAGADS